MPAGDLTLPRWLTVTRGDAPLLLSMPHTGTELAGLEARVVSPWLARKDTDWWIERLYEFAADLGATLLRTRISRTVIDVNRDPAGVSLYPGQVSTELCPTTSFDGEPLYRGGEAPAEAEVALRRREYFDPYHALLRAEIARLRARHARIVLYDCHSIRSVIPRLFAGTLPVFNLGTYSGASADAALIARVAARLAASGESHVVDGRFKGGWITREYGQPRDGVHALQMELACRAYMPEPAMPAPQDWPAPLDPARASAVRRTLASVLDTALHWLRA